MPYLDRDTRRAYQREWVQLRREAWIESQGRKCALCFRGDLQFEVDHIDRNTKVSHKVWSWSKVRREGELAKCQLLCVLCHWKKTGEENSGLNLVHGTDTGYRYGCRCPECKQAHSIVMANYRARKRVTLRV